MTRPSVKLFRDEGSGKIPAYGRLPRAVSGASLRPGSRHSPSGPALIQVDTPRGVGTCGTERAGLPGGVDRSTALRALGFVVGVNLVGALPTLVTGPNTEWFRELTKPALYPPNWAFGVAWTLLFTLIGVGLFGVQMAFNIVWTPVFFGLEAILPALGVIAVLAVLIAATVVAFDRVDRRAAALLVPYLAWVLFATYLNYGVWRLNG